MGLAKEEDVDYEPKRGTLWIGKKQVAEWQTTLECLAWTPEGLKAAGVDVSSKSLDDAVAEKMSAAK